MSRSVADTIVATLAAAGVRHAFGVPGDAINAIVDATRRNEDVEFVHVRHEEAGAFAASAQAKLTGRPAAVYGTSGPGTVHLLNGLYDAKLDHAPVLAVTGQAPTARLGTHAHQEIDQHELFSGLALFSQTLSSPDQLPTVAVEAAQAALTGRGVAHLAVPSDLAQQDVPGDGLPRVVRREPRIRPAQDDIEEALALLDESVAPTILLGVGARDAVPQTLELADRLGAPIVKSLQAKALLDDEHPLTTGGHGLLGTRASVNAMRRCDLLLMLGTDYPYRDFYPEDVPVIQVDVERSRIGRRTQVDVGLVGHADLVVDELLDRVTRNTDRSALEDAQKDMQRWWSWMEALEDRDGEPIKPERLAATAGSLLDDDAVVLCDTGAVTAWVARHVRSRAGQEFSLSGNLASMAYGLPAALGAQLAFPDRQVVAFVGDGSFTMLPSDLMTAVHLDLPITVVVFDNHKLGLIGVEEEEEGFAEQSTAIPGRDLAAIAEAFGADGIRVEHDADMEGALREAYASDRPTVVDVVVDGDELTIPPRIELAQALGFAEAKVKEFFGVGQRDGGFDALLDPLT